MSSTQAFTAVPESFRQLARIVALGDVIPHPNAEKLELALIGGWQVCVKIGEFKKGSLVLYCEIDSLVPTAHPDFLFLEERTESLKAVNGISYSRTDVPCKLQNSRIPATLESLPPFFFRNHHAQQENQEQNPLE